MIRAVLERIRNAPGPMKDMRNMVLDIAVETGAKILEKFPPQLDVLGIVAKVRDELRPADTGCSCGYGTEDYGSQPWSCGSAQPEPEPAPAPAWNPPPPEPEAPKAAKASKAAPVAAAPDADEEALLEKAFKNPEIKDTQEFKVLAILWKAARAGKGGLSAKDISAYGDEVRIRIRPENVRKVIRTKIAEYCTSKEEMVDGKRTQVFSLNSKGMKHFKDKFLKTR